jgi:hypothetical protein
MFYVMVKALLSGAIVAAVSEIARRSPAFGALVVSLPLISLLSIVWLWNDTGDPERIAAHANATFWFVLPSMPMFLALPMMLRGGVGFWTALALACLLTVVLYFAMAWLLARAGISL